MAKHYKNEVGTSLRLDTGVDLSGINEQQIRYEKPDGVTTGTWVASLLSSYSVEAGKVIGTYFVEYTLQDSDLDTVGVWKLQAWVADSTGTWYSETVEENIYDQYA